MDNFTTFLTQSASEIEKELQKVFSNWHASVQKTTPSLTSLMALLSTTNTGGKYIRGTLVLLGYQLSKGKKNNEIKKIAAAFEIMHTSLLIHDDIIDKTSVRRGKSTIHTQLGNNHYGQSLAMCLGDVGFFLAQKVIADTAFNEDKKNKVLSYFSQTILETILGEMLDVQLSDTKQAKYEHDVVTIQKLKTAYYTIVGPLTLGAMLGNVHAKQLQAIKQFGEYTGMAFQIQDDILGIFGDESKLGKSTTSDIEENKNTLLITYALKHVNTQQRRILQAYYGKEKITQKQHDAIKKVFEDTGALTYSQQKAEEYIEKSIQCIPQITKDKKLQSLLLDLTTFIVQRKK